MVLSLVFVHAYNLGWWPVYDCKPHLETNKIQNCSYFGFGGFFGLREQPIKPAFQHFKTMVNPSIVTVLSAHRCETEKLQIRRSKF